MINNRIELIGTVPHEIYIAVSGGSDSMAALDFLLKGRRYVQVLHFNHGTEHGAEAEKFVTQYCFKNSIPLYVGYISREKLSTESPEEYWRNERYNFFNQFTDKPIVMAHNLDDQAEQYLMSSMHGKQHLIPYRRNNVIRPFITTTKSCLLNWCTNKDVPFIVDPSNSSLDYMRSYVRTELMPRALHVNPGLLTVVKKKVKAEYHKLMDEEVRAETHRMLH